jgi:cell division protein FtsB
VTRRRRQDGPPGAPGQVPPAGARTRGAWTTPAVVVRGPDGRVVDPGGGPRRPAARGDADAGRTGAEDAPGRRRTPGADDDEAGARGSVPGTASGSRRRVRPRRIPGAPGAVLLTPTLLTGAADGREDRRRRRREAPVATVTPLPPRPPRSDDDADGDAGDQPARPRLRPVWPASPAGPSRPGARRQRVTAALAGLNFDRLLPPDEEARARRALRLRRCATAVASVGLVVVLIYSVFPVRTWIDQRSEADRAREQLEVFERENARLEQEARDLRTDERTEELARELGLVMPGEELYGVLPGPEAPADTPPTTVPDE